MNPLCWFTPLYWLSSRGWLEVEQWSDNINLSVLVDQSPLGACMILICWCKVSDMNTLVDS